MLPSGKWFTLKFVSRETCQVLRTYHNKPWLQTTHHCYDRHGTRNYAWYLDESTSAHNVSDYECSDTIKPKANKKTMSSNNQQLHKEERSYA